MNVNEKGQLMSLGPRMWIDDCSKCNGRWAGHVKPAYSKAVEYVRIDEAENLRELIRCLVENDPMDPISDAGHVLLDLWRHDARKALGLPEQPNR